MHALFPALAAALLVFAVSACGNRGPLYLPPEDPAPQAAGSDQPQAEDGSESEEDAGPDDA